MQCYTELLPPSAVTHCLTIPFLNANSRNLIVAKTSLLQVFSINVRSKLVLVAEQHLSGTITALGRLKPIRSRSGGDALLVAVKDAKMSLVEWDPERHCFATISIHYYEGEDLQMNPFTPELSQCRSILTVDPSSRCAALKFGPRNLAILPFHQPGDDLVMDEFGPDFDGEKQETTARDMNGYSHDSQTIYARSFVLPMSAIDPHIVHPIHFAFLHEYREPTFGILYSQVAPASSLLYEKKDVIFYSVFTLDIDQKASTTLLSISRLPNDLHKVVPLPLPVGGALLVGGNELVHVDQGGKTNSIGVNEFARQNSSFSMADQSDLAMKLERCVIEQFGPESADMLVGLNTGELAILSFKLDGRSVSGLTIQRVAFESGGRLLGAGPSCAAVARNGLMFFGSEESDSSLISWNSRSGLKRQRSIVDYANLEETDEIFGKDDDMDDYEDDLYSGNNEMAATDSLAASPTTTYSDHVFRIADRLPNLGPLRGIAVGRSHTNVNADRKQQDDTAILELLAPSGNGGGGGVAVLKRALDPVVVSESVFKGVVALWTVRMKEKNGEMTNGATEMNVNFDQFLVMSKATESGAGQSKVYRMSGEELEELKGTEFEPDAGSTVGIGTLADGTRMVQALESEVRSYDGDFGLAQIYPMADEETGAEPSVLSTSYSDPFVLLLRDDGSILVLEADKSGDLDALSHGPGIACQNWLAGCLYHDKETIFNPMDGQASSNPKATTLLFLLNDKGSIRIFTLANLDEPVCSLENVGFLPPILSPDHAGRRYASPDTVTEILVASLGDCGSSSPFLMLRTDQDEIALYEPFHLQTSSPDHFSYENLRFSKIPSYFLPQDPSEGSSGSASQNVRYPMRALPDVGGFKAVAIPGFSPSFILKSSSSCPRVVPIRNMPVCCFSSYNKPSCQNGFAFIDIEGTFRTALLLSDVSIWDSSWISKKIELGKQVDFLCSHATTNLYILGTCQKADFHLPLDDELHPEWQNEELSLFPQLERGSIELLTPQTWSIIDSYLLEKSERVLCMESLSLQIEDAREWKEFIAVGTGLVRGEDVAMRGCVYVFEVIDVAPDPERPETDRKLKVFAQEELKGAVTAISPIGTEGCLLVAQGQKCLVRGLKEDGNLVPVAFIDVQTYVSVAKELRGTGMCILGDAMNGLWLVGYTEEPYRMILFGKDNLGQPVAAAEFLPDGKQLFVISADDDCKLHVLQFDPENPKSLSGQRLLHRSTFHTGYFPTSLTLLPRTSVGLEAAMSSEDQMDTDGAYANRQIIATFQGGAMGLITPLSESSYRRLSALQMQLWNTLDQTCGLNPRAYRAAESDGIGGRTMVDGTILRRWLEFGNQRRRDIAGRAGAEMWEIKGDMEIVSGGGLGYL